MALGKEQGVGLPGSWDGLSSPDLHAVTPRADRVLKGPCFATHETTGLAAPLRQRQGLGGTGS